MMARGHLFFLLNLQIMKTRRHSKRGGGYGFGGSLLDGSSSNSGNTLWKSDTGSDCGSSTARGGNGFTGGRRRRLQGGQLVPPTPQSDSTSSVGGRRRRLQGGQLVPPDTSDAPKDVLNALKTTGGRRRRHKGGQDASAVPPPPPAAGGLFSQLASTVKSTVGARRRKGGKSRRRYKGGGHDLAQNVPRANYSFQGEGTRGLADWAHDTY